VVSVLVAGFTSRFNRLQDHISFPEFSQSDLIDVLLHI
jgi:hypothetical protein